MSSTERGARRAASLMATAALVAAATGCALPAPAAAPPSTTASASPVPPAEGAGLTHRLVGPEWVVEDLDRRGIIDRSRVTLAFEPDGRTGGRAGCNAWTGRWTLDGERLALSGIAVTARACAPALELQEARFLATLRQPMRVDFTGPDGALRLSADGGGSILARRE
jgi:heat shock protein HslJ